MNSQNRYGVDLVFRTPLGCDEEEALCVVESEIAQIGTSLCWGLVCFRVSKRHYLCVCVREREHRTRSFCRVGCSRLQAILILPFTLSPSPTCLTSMPKLCELQHMPHLTESLPERSSSLTGEQRIGVKYLAWGHRAVTDLLLKLRSEPKLLGFNLDNHSGHIRKPEEHIQMTIFNNY